MRDLTCHRTELTGGKTRAVNRIHKILEDANIKLSSVASDIMGKSGCDMIGALIAMTHSILEAIYHMLRRGLPYQELRSDCFDRRHPERIKRQCVHRPNDMGYRVQLEESQPLA